LTPISVELDDAQVLVSSGVLVQEGPDADAQRVRQALRVEQADVDVSGNMAAGRDAGRAIETLQRLQRISIARPQPRLRSLRQVPVHEPHQRRGSSLREPRVQFRAPLVRRTLTGRVSEGGALARLKVGQRWRRSVHDLIYVHRATPNG
jgi:hypothetical protein